MTCACCPHAFGNSCVWVVGTSHYLSMSSHFRVSTVLTMKAMPLEGKCVNWKMEAANHVFSVGLGHTGANTLPSF